MAIKLRAIWQGVEQGDEVEKLLRSWFPLVRRKRRFDIPLEETETGKYVGSLLAFAGSEKMGQVMAKQLSWKYPGDGYVKARLRMDTETGKGEIVEEK